MENPTKAITATLRMIIAIAATSMVESRLAMRHFGGRRAAALIWIMRPTLTNRRTPGDPDAMARVAGFLQGLQELGWATDRNIQIDYRWAVGQDELYRKYAVELVALQPDVWSPQ